MPSANDIRKGNVINYNGEPHLVLESQHRTPGNLRAFVQAKLRSIRSGSSSVVRFGSTDSVEFLMTESKPFELSYMDRDGYHFMCPETFEDLVLSEDFIGDAKFFITEGGTVNLLFVEGAAVQLDLPSAVELEVTDAPEAIRGDTSGAAQKTVTTSTGLAVRTPLFIKNGDRIKVSTEDKGYLGRV